MELIATGQVSKMQTDHAEQIGYQLPLDDALIDLNPLIGKPIRLAFEGEINCTNCGKKTAKSYSQGHCFPCMKKLARCDSCIMSPEKCHYDNGTCREPEWGEKFCMTDHYVYLANSSGLKVGITRGSQVPTRWMDQGAIQALPILRVATRQLSGLVEVIFKQHTADKTNWRTMLKGEVVEIDLEAERERLFEAVDMELSELEKEHGFHAIERLWEEPVYEFSYPVNEYPTKITSFNLDKKPEAQGVLQGIKGQYLIMDTGVINIRKYTGYRLSIFADS